MGAERGLRKRRDLLLARVATVDKNPTVRVQGRAGSERPKADQAAVGKQKQQ